jgi:predicted RNA-binding protein YlxR (DUF448 family)
MSDDVRESIRTCVGCRRRAPASTLVTMTLAGGPRWIAWPPQVSFGLTSGVKRRSAGRAAHLHRSVDCVRRGTERGALEHALRVPKGSLEKGALEQARQVLLSEVLASLGAEHGPGARENKRITGEETSVNKGAAQGAASKSSAAKRQGRVRL